MDELRLESSDGEYLILEGTDGTTHRLLIDEALRKAVRRELFSSGDSNLISPREIQLEVRNGVTIEEISAKTGASLEYVEKFAAPVIDELAHIVQSALSVRLTMAGDRYNQTTQVEFGAVVANRLASQGVLDANWTARKTENNGWQIQCHFGNSVATWAFDPRKLHLSPENESAVSLSAQQALSDSPIPRLRPVTETEVELSVEPQAETETFVAPALSAVPTPAVVAEPEPVEEVNLTVELGDTAEFEGVIPFGRQEPAASAFESKAPPTEDLANTADLLDALRKRRMERERDVFEAATGAIPIIAEELFAQPASAQAEDSPEPTTDEFDGLDEPAAETKPIDLPDAEKPKKPGRSSMPSWDEIVFNTRHDE